ncbi:DMT family transporter [Salidesulfovibrio onnuriiensis]|uniref:DMT family transporter n=1 Tax=Salidesulfovibrio onnuriiensis TaxID=2583823 RepID=UPI0011C9CE2E|nr:DMT family transporter [Salidesulfovibrio onnuriiensis]
MKQTTTHMRGYGLALISAAIISQTGIFVRFLTESHSLAALDLVFWRNIILGATLAALALVTGRPRLGVPFKRLLFLAGYGLVLAIFNAIWTTAVICNGAAVATVLAYCSVGYTALLGTWLFRERLDAPQKLAAGLCLAGCLLVSDALVPEAWRLNALGIVTGILSGLLYAAYSLMGRFAAQRGINAWTTMFHIFSFAALFQLAGILLLGKSIPILSAGPSLLLLPGAGWQAWAWLAAYAVGPTLIGFGLYATSLKHLPAATANIILTLELVFTGLTANLLFGEAFNQTQWAGCILIVAAVLLVNQSLRKREAPLITTLKESENAHEHL